MKKELIRDPILLARKSEIGRMMKRIVKIISLAVVVVITGILSLSIRPAYSGVNYIISTPQTILPLCI